MMRLLSGGKKAEKSNYGEISKGCKLKKRSKGYLIEGMRIMANCEFDELPGF